MSSLPPGVIALAHALREALDLPAAHTGQIMLNNSDGTLQSVETRTFQRAQTVKLVDKAAQPRAHLTR